MKPGTPGFVGMRLREAREARGLTAISLAELIGVSRQAISQYETDEATPSPETLYRLAAVLNIPVEFFRLPPRRGAPTTVFYRSMASATKIARTKAERRFDWLEDIALYVLKYVELPAARFPRLADVANPTVLDTDSIEQAASAIRRHWGLGDGPISNVAWLLENNGAVIARGALQAEELDAFSKRGHDGRPYLFLTTDKQSAARSRFDAGHELGHVVLHDAVEPRMLANRGEFKLIEEQANYFASAFLLPATTFSKDLYAPTLDVMRALKSKWRVSIGAMIMRAKHLQLVSEEYAQTLFAMRARRGWNRHEPLDDSLPLEEPRVLKQAMDLLVREQVCSKASIIEDLGLSATDVEDLVGLPRGFFSEELAPIRLLDRSAARRAGKSGSADDHAVVRFTRDEAE